jgi:putative ABC transport system ATP-binding protein
MTLLALEHVGKRYSDGPRERVALRDVSMQLDAGQLGVIWGLRRSGRSTLLRLAAGIEAPDNGSVRFDGRDLAAERHTLLGDGIGYAQKVFAWDHSLTVLEVVTVALLARGVEQGEAGSRARSALERTGAASAATLAPGELDTAEAVRVELARALVLEPRLLIVDEPTKGVDLLERDEILLLLRSLAEEGTGVLMSTGESTALAGADRAFALGDGELRSASVPEVPQAAELADVLPLRRAAGPG